MASATLQKILAPIVGARYSWIQMVADTLQRFSTAPEDNLFTMVQPCVIKGCPAVVFERDLHNKEPILFKYLQSFAVFNEMKLIEDRRADRAEVVMERRQQWAPVVALGAGMMLRNSQHLGGELVPSTPHVLHSGEAGRSAREVIQLAARLRGAGRLSELESNSMMTPNRKRSYVVNYYEQEIEERGSHRVFSYFEGNNFHALGYLSGDQICLHTLVAGGPFNGPRLWGPIQRMARDPVQLHYMKGRGGLDGFGVFQAVYYLEYTGSSASGQIE